MKLKEKHLVFFVFFIYLNGVFSKESVKTSGTNYTVTQNLDSLANKSYETLEKKYIESQRKQSTLSYLYAKALLLKAKKRNDFKRMGDGYKYLAAISHEDLQLTYLDSLIEVTKKINHKEYPGVGYIGKGVFFKKKYDYNKALKNYLIAQKYADSNNNIYHKIAIKHNIALLNKAVGGKKEAVKIFKENLKFIKTQDTLNKFFRIHVATLFAIADSYHRMSQPDLARPYVSASLKKMHKAKSDFLYPSLLMASGINNNLKGNHKIALDSLFKASSLIDKAQGNNQNKTIIYFEIAKSLLNLKENIKAINYLKRIDSLIDDKNYIPENKDAFIVLSKQYKKQRDVSNQLRTISKLIRMDSIFYNKNLTLKADIASKYNSAQLIKKRDDIIQSLKKEKNRSYYYFLGLLLISFLLSFMFLFYYRKQKVLKARYKKILDQKRLTKEISPKFKIQVITDDQQLSEAIVSPILEKLNTFENNKHYLNPNLKMNEIAKKMNTNSSYFSKVVNVHKGKNFTNYVNDLRIEFCIEKLRYDNIFIKYSIKAIGEEVGFKNVQSFSRAFYRNTGIQPSFFIKELEKERFKDHNQERF